MSLVAKNPSSRGAQIFMHLQDVTIGSRLVIRSVNAWWQHMTPCSMPIYAESLWKAEDREWKIGGEREIYKMGSKLLWHLAELHLIRGVYCNGGGGKCIAQHISIYNVESFLSKHIFPYMIITSLGVNDCCRINNWYQLSSNPWGQQVAPPQPIEVMLSHITVTINKRKDLNIPHANSSDDDSHTKGLKYHFNL